MENIVDSFNEFEDQNIYKHLADDVSKRIYQDSICYSYTGDENLLLKRAAYITDDSPRGTYRKKCIKNLQKFEEEYLDNLIQILRVEKEAIVICGANGYWGKVAMERLSAYRPVACDNNGNNGAITIEEAKLRYPRTLYLIVSKKYANEIREELKKSISPELFTEQYLN